MEQKQLEGLEDMSNYIVVNTRNSQEFIRMVPVIENLSKMGPILFTRCGSDTRLLTEQLYEDIRNNLHTQDYGPILPLTTRSLKKELENRDMRMSMFVGSHPDIFTKKPNTIENSDVIEYRYVSVCTKCESIIHESVKKMTVSQVEDRLKEHREHPFSREIDTADKQKVSVIVTEDSCTRGCN